jgi:tetratricopeptide (TPR) repeat protein
MKRRILFCLMVAICVSAIPPISMDINFSLAENAKAEINQKKKFSIRCSPIYIPGKDDQIQPLPGWGNYSWTITTTSDSAQFYFNQGINMYYAFHIIEARASFDKATRLDPACAMAWWGKALAFGPNINDFEYQQPIDAFAAVTLAKQLSTNCNEQEKALINAMTVRYTGGIEVSQTDLNNRYKEAMKDVYEKYENHPEVPTLYADALMLLHPWDLYEHDFTPKKWTPEIVKVLQKALKLNSANPGANHLYIHAMEASAHPEEALQSAEKLCNAMPGVSHLTHMPSHIYIRTGFYNKGIVQNNKALSAYKNYLLLFPSTQENVALYSLHNLHMKMSCANMAGNYLQSINAANELQNSIPTYYLSIPGPLANYAQYLYQSPLITNIRFGKWNEILSEKVNDTLAFIPVMQHFGRGMAFAHEGNETNAEKELMLLRNKMEHQSLKVPLAPFNSGYDAALVAERILTGIIASRKKDYKTAISALTMAVEKEDKMIYNEPKDWLNPARQYLGQAYLDYGKYNEAINVFKKDLVINPNNGWSLTGLANAYRALPNKIELAAVEKRLKSAWLISDMKIKKAVF